MTWNVDTRGADRDGPCVAAGVARKVAAATAARGSAKRRERDRGDAADAGERQRVACGARRETSGVKRQGARVHVRVGTWARARGRACVGIRDGGRGRGQRAALLHLHRLVAQAWRARRGGRLQRQVDALKGGPQAARQGLVFARERHLAQYPRHLAQQRHLPTQAKIKEGSRLWEWTTRCVRVRDMFSFSTSQENSEFARKLRSRCG